MRYIGSVGPANRDSVLGGAFALLQIIDFAEPFGLSMIEAMACGVPAIARGFGSVPEVIEHGETGFIANTIDKAAGALAQVEKLKPELIRRYVADNFSRERMVEVYIRVYEEVLADAESKRRHVATV